MNKRIKLGIIILIVLLLSGCESKKYTIKIINDNGEILSSVMISEGDNIDNVEEPEKDGYIFVGLFKDGIYYDTSTPVYDDMTLIAKYTEIPNERDSYIVIFNFGEFKKTKTIKIGDKINRPDDPIRDGYKFLGWYYENEKYNFDEIPDKSIELTAKWKKFDYVKITFELDGGTGIKEISIEKGQSLTVPDAPKRMGYKFLGWYYGNEKYNFDEIILNDITLVAKWEAIQYVKVSFDSDGGTEIKSQMIEMGSNITTLDIPKKKGYKFLYWTLDGEIFNEDMIIDNDIKLFAKYEKI